MSRTGLFDSGVGGLSVLRYLLEKNPSGNYSYFADTARVPYGVREKSEIYGFVREITGLLADRGCDPVIAACATATSSVPDDAEFPVKFIGAIQPTARAAAAQTKNGNVALIATDATVRSGLFDSSLRRLMPDVKLLPVRASVLVPYVEHGIFGGDELAKELDRLLGAVNESDADTLILGCTHFPLIKDEIRRRLSPRIGIVDVSEQTALAALPFVGSGRGEIDFSASGDPDSFRAVAAKIMGFEITLK